MNKIILIFLIIGVLVVSGCTQYVNTVTKPPEGKFPDFSNLDMTPVYGCVEDSDCVIGMDVCGSDVYSKNWIIADTGAWDLDNVPEYLEEWAKNKWAMITGMKCEEAIKSAQNPRCENSTCTADYNQF